MRHTLHKILSSAFALACALHVASPVRADDRDAFSAKPAPPNIMWMLDNSGSMDNLPCTEFSTGVCFGNTDRALRNEINLDPTLGAVGAAVSLCRSTFMDSLGYNKNTAYPLPDPDFPALYPATRIYQKDNWGSTSADAATYCSGITTNCAQRARCVYSMTKYGYYYDVAGCQGSGDPSGLCAPVPRACTTNPLLTDVGGGCAVGATCDCGLCSNQGSGVKCQECNLNADCGAGNTCATVGGVRRCQQPALATVSIPRMSGNLLRLYPPKFVGGRRAVKDILVDANNTPTLSHQRVGLFAYNGNNGGDGGSVRKRMGPVCNQLCLDASCDAAFTTSRNAMIGIINTMPFNTNTPLGETLDDIGCYFANGNPPRPCTYRTDQVIAQDNASPPMCLSCQTNFAILITDGLPTSDTTAGLSLASGVSDPQGYILPAVARYMYNTDLDTATAGVQNIITYTVSFGLTDPTDANKCAGVLERAAQAGNGKCFPARNRQQLRDALATIVFEIDQRARSFTSPTLQSTRAQGENNANMAVFKPFTSGPLWEGHVYSFNLFDEVTENAQFPTGSAANKQEVFVVDANNAPVAFDTEGNLLGRPFWDAALCLAGDVDNTRGATVPEDPFNLNVSGCVRRPDETSARARKILTKLNPLVGTGGSVPDNFTVTNAGVLAPLIGAAMPFAAPKVIKYFRGFDMLDLVGGGTVGAGTVTVNTVTYTTPVERSLSTLGQKKGWWVLGDIYHSTPGLVIQTGEYLDDNTYKNYEDFFAATKGRKRVVVAGANDGMLHAFDAGSAQNATPPIVYSKGTGEELWAFVPPHHLPKLGGALSCPNDAGTPCTIARQYQYSNDGSAQIRDAYTGSGTQRGTLGNLQDPSLANLWKTIYVTGDRDGGNRFTALDVTNPASPEFLWQFPTVIGPGLNQRAEPPGLSWSDVFSNPAPIFPVMFDADGDLGTPADQYRRFVVLVNGGFSRNQIAGRGVYMLDANDGTLLWKFEYSNVDAEHQAMRYSFAATFGGLGYPAASDTVTYGIGVDTGGQVWLFDFSQPGVLSGGLAQWSGKRVFTTAASTATTAPYGALPNADNTVQLAEYPYRGMYSMVAASYGRNGRDVWVYVGTGDRDLIGNPALAHSSGVALDPGLVDVSCGRAPYNSGTHVNRLYALKIRADLIGSTLGRRVAAQPNNEDDLFPLNTPAAFGEVRAQPLNNADDPNTYGWYLMLRPGEKVNNAAHVSNKVVYFTTYTPTGACQSAAANATQTCDSPSGSGRLYALDFETGRPAIDFNSAAGAVSFGAQMGVTTSSADTSKDVGAGLPTAPGVSIGVGNGRQSAAMLMATSNDPTPQGQRAPAPTTLVKRVLSTFVPDELHNTLQSLGSTH